MPHIVFAMKRRNPFISLPLTMLHQRMVFSSEYFQDSDYDDEMFLESLSSVRSRVEELRFDQINMKQLDLLKNLTFPKVKVLDYRMQTTGVERSDADTLLIVEIFPSLNNLRCNSGITTGKHICEMQNLSNLNLSGCKNLKADELLKIIARCNHLKSMDISGTNINEEFLQDANAVVRSSKRSVPLELRIAKVHLLDGN